MNRIINLPIVILASLWLLITSCNTTKSTTSPTNFSEETLLEMSTMERLVTMQTGTFIMYDSIQSKLRLMNGDTLVFFSCPVGDANKDGYWIYRKFYMSSIPDNPLSTEFLHLTKVSRDSFVAEQFEADKAYNMGDVNPSVFKELDFKKLKSINCPITFQKLDQLNFEGQTSICTITFDGDKTRMYANFFGITPQGVYLRTSYYHKKEGKFEYESKGDGYLKLY